MFFKLKQGCGGVLNYLFVGLNEWPQTRFGVNTSLVLIYLFVGIE